MEIVPVIQTVQLWCQYYYIFVKLCVLLYTDYVSKDVERNVNAAIEYAKVFGVYHMQRKNNAENDMRKMHHIFRVRQRPVSL